MGKNTKPEFTFAHVHIKCRDFESAKKFYEEMFHAKTLREDMRRNARIAMMDIGGTLLHISEVEQGEKLEEWQEPRKTVWIRYGLSHFGFRVNDLDKAVRELKAKGADFIQEPRQIREGVSVAYLRGPEDDVIELSQRSASFESLLRRSD